VALVSLVVWACANWPRNKAIKTHTNIGGCRDEDITRPHHCCAVPRVNASSWGSRVLYVQSMGLRAKVIYNQASKVR
jgi:hypothetical protein